MSKFWLAATAVFLSAVACSSENGPAGRAFFLSPDESGSPFHVDYFPPPASPFDQAMLSSLVFTGAVSGYTEAVHSGDDMVHDGVEFEVLEVLKGDEHLTGETVTILTPVLQQSTGDVVYDARVLDLKSGFDALTAEGSEPVRFVVFVEDGPIDDTYVLAGPGPTSRILPDGTLSMGAGFPFTRAKHGRWLPSNVSILHASDVVKWLECGDGQSGSAIFDFGTDDTATYGHPTPEAAANEFMSSENGDWRLRRDWHNLTVGATLGSTFYFVNDVGDTYLIVQVSEYDSYWLVNGYQSCAPA